MNDLDIPEFLIMSDEDRRAGWARYIAANHRRQIIDGWRERNEEQRAIRTEKSRVRIEKLKAHKSGRAARLPSQGRDAMRVIEEKEK